MRSPFSPAVRPDPKPGGTLPEAGRQSWLRQAFSSLRARLLGVIAIVLIPGIALVSYLGSELYRQEAHEIELNMSQILESVRLDQVRSRDSAAELLTLMALVPEIREQRGDYCKLMRGVLEKNRQYADIGITDGAGNVLCNASGLPGAANLSDQPWFMRATDTLQLASDCDHQDGPNGQRPVLVLALPILDGGQQTKAVLYAAVDIGEGLMMAVAERRLPAATYVALQKADGSVMATMMAPIAWAAVSKTGFGALAIPGGGTTGRVESAWPDDVLRHWTFAPLSSSGEGAVRMVGVGVPAEHFAGMQAIFLRTFLVAGLVGLAFVSLAWLSYRRFILRKTDKLVHAAHRFAEGDWSARSGIRHGSSEFGILARAMDEMAEAVQAREKEIALRQFALDQHSIVSIADAHGRITFANDKFCEISGYPREELIGRNHRILNSGFHPPEFFENLWSTISAGKVWQGLVRNRSKRGDCYWVTSTIVPFVDDAGKPYAYFSIRTDLTALLKVEEALHRSEEMYRLLAEHSQDVVSLHDVDGRVLYVSPAFERMLGFESHRVVGHEPWSLVHLNDVDTVRQFLLEPIVKGAPHASAVFRMRHRQGHHVWVELTATPVLGANGAVNRVQATMRNVSRRKEVENRLMLRDMAIQSSLTGVMLFSARDDNPVVYVNPAFERITGHTAEDIVSRPVLSVFDRTEDDQSFARIRAAVCDATEGRAPIRFTRRDGTMRHADCSVAPVHDSREGTTHFVVALNDTTERMLVLEEMRQAKEESDRANRAKTEFLSRVTHELRTPLNAILGFAQLLEAQAANLTELQQDGVARILKSGWHLRELIDEILDLARVEAGNLEIRLEDVALAPLADECMAVVQFMAAERGIGIAVAGASDSGMTVRADRTRLKQVLLNLLSNAIKFNRDGGTVTIDFRMTGPGVARISVHDTGPGIEPERQGELFRPFSRLDADRAQIPGTGIGLAISNRFVQLMEGRIGIESEQGMGSVFWVELPMAEDVRLLV